MPADGLPRMDVAVFVGFAQRGPLHCPVALEDARQFLAVFGPAPRLNWDPSRQLWQRGLLEPAVRAFFANGGLRCWVIRVADDDARAGVFQVPGCISLWPEAPGLTVAPARLQAASRGSWSDVLRLSARARVRPLLLAAAPAPAHPALWVAQALLAPRAGDLLRLRADNGSTLDWFPVQEVQRTGATSFLLRTGTGVRSTELGPVAAGGTGLVDGLSDGLMDGLTDGQAVEVSLTGLPSASAPGSVSGRLVADAGGFAVRLAGAGSGWVAGLAVGGMLSLRLGPGHGHRNLVFMLERIAFGGAAGAMDQAVLGGRAWQLDTRLFPAPAAALAEIVSLDLRAQEGQGASWQLEDLMPVAGHERSVAALPTDEATAGMAVATMGAEGEAGRRWPLAALPSTAAAAPAELIVPLGLGTTWQFSSTAEASAVPALVRDGLAVFDASLFLDNELADAGRDALLARADFIRYQAQDTRPLRGIHAALGWQGADVGGDATLIVVPDAVHVPWRGGGDTADGCEWRRATEAVQAAPALFSACPGPLPAPAVVGRIDSEGRRATLAWTMPVVAPAVATYVVQESTLPDFRPVDAEQRQPGALFTVTGPVTGPRRFRVRAETPASMGAWSDTMTLQPAGSLPPLAAAGGADDSTAADWPALLEIQQAVLRLCAARGDLFAVLSLPRDCREPAAIAHARRLAVGVDGDGHAASFGALYHPWVDSAATGREPLPQPPDGGAAGLIAARSRERGAWVAPANVLLRGALALCPQPEPRPLAFVGTGINLVQHLPAGIGLLSAETLSATDDLRPLQVRRLLMLLRRLALRLGEPFVFEPNGPVLRSFVRLRFEQALEQLYRRGALAGRRAEEAFQVNVIVPTDADERGLQGQLVVELRVRPAQALQFLTLRLLLSVSGATQLEAA